jgi:hypothetical protein
MVIVLTTNIGAWLSVISHIIQLKRLLTIVHHTVHYVPTNTRQDDEVGGIDQVQLNLL